MAEDGRMTAAQAVDKLMGSEHADVIRESVRFMVDALMEAEVSEVVGAEYGERAPERRIRPTVANATRRPQRPKGDSLTELLLYRNLTPAVGLLLAG